MHIKFAHLGVGGVWNFAHLRLRRLWLGAKKDKEKSLFVRVQLIRLKDETDKFQVVDVSIASAANKMNKHIAILNCYLKTYCSK